MPGRCGSWWRRNTGRRASAGKAWIPAPSSSQGETSRKENARAVLDALSDFAGEFVVATAGPDLESVLAAKGAGAVDYSQRTGKTVLHMDIGGGTSNLALIRDGKIERTGCLNVGGRLLKFDGGGTVTYVSPVLDGLCGLKPGDKASPGQVKTVAEISDAGAGNGGGSAGGNAPAGAADHPGSGAV